MFIKWIRTGVNATYSIMSAPSLSVDELTSVAEAAETVPKTACDEVVDAGDDAISAVSSSDNGVTDVKKPPVSKNFDFSISAKVDFKKRARLQLVFLEGCHGVGKTTLAKKLSDKGHSVLFEKFDHFFDYACRKLPQDTPIEEIVHYAQLGYIHDLVEAIELSYVHGEKIMFIDRGFLSPFIMELFLKHTYQVKICFFPKNHLSIGVLINFRKNFKFLFTNSFLVLSDSVNSTML